MPNKTSILIVDDDAAVRESIRMVLEKEKRFVIHEAVNGKEGIKLARQKAFEIIVLDLLMPEMDGLEVIREIRLHLPNVKVLAISGGGRASPATYLKMAEQLGADMTLMKPFSASELLRTVALLQEKPPTHSDS